MIVHVGAYNPSCYLFRKEELSSTLSALSGVWISLQGESSMKMSLFTSCSPSCPPFLLSIFAPLLPHFPPLKVDDSCIVNHLHERVVRATDDDEASVVSRDDN